MQNPHEKIHHRDNFAIREKIQERIEGIKCRRQQICTVGCDSQHISGTAHPWVTEKSLPMPNLAHKRRAGHAQKNIKTQPDSSDEWRDNSSPPGPVDQPRSEWGESTFTSDSLPPTTNLRTTEKQFLYFHRIKNEKLMPPADDGSKYPFISSVPNPRSPPLCPGRVMTEDAVQRRQQEPSSTGL